MTAWGSTVHLRNKTFNIIIQISRHAQEPLCLLHIRFIWIFIRKSSYLVILRPGSHERDGREIIVSDWLYSGKKKKSFGMRMTIVHLPLQRHPLKLIATIGISLNQELNKFNFWMSYLWNNSIIINIWISSKHIKNNIIIIKI